MKWRKKLWHIYSLVIIRTGNSGINCNSDTSAVTHIDFSMHSFDDKAKCEHFSVYFLDQMIPLPSNQQLKHRYQVYCLTNEQTMHSNRRGKYRPRLIWINVTTKQTSRQTSKTDNSEFENSQCHQNAPILMLLLSNIRSYQNHFCRTHFLSFEMIICCRDIQIRNGDREITHTALAIVALVIDNNWKLKMCDRMCTRQWCSFRLGCVKYKAYVRIQSHAQIWSNAEEERKKRVW